MRILLSTVPKPIPMMMDKYLSIDDSSYRFVVDQGIFSVNSENHCYSLHFLAQNIAFPSTVLEWPTMDELADELRKTFYDYVGFSVKVIDLTHVSKAIDLIKKVSPKTKVMVGGFGMLGIEDLREFGVDIADKADLIVRGEGVEFINNLAGVTHRLPRTSFLPLERIRSSWLPQETKVGYVLSALGCPVRCEFCATTAFIADGKVHEVMTPMEIYKATRAYFDAYRDFHMVYVMDENFLAYKKKVNEIGKLLREDDAYGLSRLNMQSFGTIKAISLWDPEELLLNGVSGIWSGVESFYSYDRKKGKEVAATINGLHDNGIQTILSWIVGDDCQTKENIADDVNQFVALKPPSAQFSVLTAMPGTPMWYRLKKEGRLLPFVAGEMHLLGNSLDSQAFTHQERIDIVFGAYKKMYETNGTAIMRQMDVELNGYRVCKNSSNPYLNSLEKGKLGYFQKRVVNSATLFGAAKKYAPNAHVKGLMDELEAKYIEIVGPLTKSQKLLTDHFLKLADQAHEKVLRDGQPTPVEPPMMRWDYPGIDRNLRGEPAASSESLAEQALPTFVSLTATGVGGAGGQ